MAAAEKLRTSQELSAESIVELRAGQVDKSILIRDDHIAGARYRLLDTLRQYGRNTHPQIGLRACLQHQYVAWIVQRPESRNL